METRVPHQRWRARQVFAPLFFQKLPASASPGQDSCESDVVRPLRAPAVFLCELLCDLGDSAVFRGVFHRSPSRGTALRVTTFERPSHQQVAPSLPWKDENEYGIDHVPLPCPRIRASVENTTLSTRWPPPQTSRPGLAFRGERFSLYHSLRALRVFAVFSRASPVLPACFAHLPEISS